MLVKAVVAAKSGREDSSMRFVGSPAPKPTPPWDVGSHRNKTWAPTVTIQDDLEKRAFWTLSFLDTQLSGSLGRSAVLDPVQMDVTLPAECDDEHWQPWGLGFQPQDKPSSMAFFNCLINLYRNFHLVLRTLYTIRVNQIRMESTHQLPCLAAELDAALDKWFTSLPQHLVWLPDGLDGIVFDQSAVLHCLYYYTRILIHRPFVPGLSLLHESNPDALGICTQAAKACICVADIHRRRRPNNPLLFRRRTGELRDSRDDLALIYKAVGILETQQERWVSCEFFVCVFSFVCCTSPREMVDDLCFKTTLRRVLALDEDSTGQFDDFQHGSNVDSFGTFQVHASTTQTSEPGPTDVASPWPFPDASTALPPNPPAPPQQIWFPPVFVGDEEIVRRRVYWPPVR
ncbi:hypothetical protein DFH06DRAFT_755910 [Mycena polygramma]|nr:hypothetical protein DFH06DRAFT_755910 [Mycena polygramma]